MEFTIHPQGDRALQIAFRQELSPEVNQQVLSLCHTLEQARLPGILNIIPAYRTLLVEYDPLRLTCQEAMENIRNLPLSGQWNTRGRLVEIPLCYGDIWGPDLQDVAQHTGLSPEEVIRRHSSGTYRVYMLGFRPGFPYLGGMDPALATPRRTTPRLKIPAGSVGIAGEQTGIYPEESPGGWNLIGRTPLTLFREDTGSLLHPGDSLKFVPISQKEFEKLRKKGGSRP